MPLSTFHILRDMYTGKYMRIHLVEFEADEAIDGNGDPVTVWRPRLVVYEVGGDVTVPKVEVEWNPPVEYEPSDYYDTDGFLAAIADYIDSVIEDELNNIDRTPVDM